jgi:hypothetical protein
MIFLQTVNVQPKPGWGGIPCTDVLVPVLKGPTGLLLGRVWPLSGHMIGSGQHLAADGLKLDLGQQETGRYPLEHAPLPDCAGVQVAARPAWMFTPGLIAATA